MKNQKKILSPEHDIPTMGMPAKSNPPCAICGKELGATLLVIDKPDRFEERCGVMSDNYARQWVECSHCGAVTNQLPQDSASKLDVLRTSYYEVDFANSDIGEKYRKVMSMPATQSDNAGRVLRIIEFLRQWLPDVKAPKALDIGAGTGVFLSRFLDKTAPTWQGVGIEPDPHAATHLRSLNKFEVFEGLYQGQSQFSNFALVTLNKVLEHISNPVPLLKQVTNALSLTGSILYVELPDKLTIQHRPPQDNILGALHCHLYDPQSLGYLFRQCGLETLKIERIVEPSEKITVFGFACLPQTLSKL